MEDRPALAPKATKATAANVEKYIVALEIFVFAFAI